MPEIKRDLIGDLGALDTATPPPASEALVDPAREAAGPTADDGRQRVDLCIICMIVDIHAANARSLPRPEVALPTTDPDKAQILELDVAEMALVDMPKQHRLAKPVVWRLSKGTRARDRAAAVVKPLTDEVPTRDVAHEQSPI